MSDEEGELYSDFSWKRWWFEKFICGLRTKHKLNVDVPTVDGQYKTCKCGYHRWWKYKI